MRITTINELENNTTKSKRIAEGLISDIISEAYHRMGDLSNHEKFRIRFKITPLKNLESEYR